VFQEAPGLEQRLAELQAQIDRLTVALQLWRDAQERSTPADQRLRSVADDAADVLAQWDMLNNRHVRAVELFEQQVAAFGAIESRLHQESAERFETLHRMVQQEWAALRRPLQLEPSGARRDQAVELTHACVAAAASFPVASPEEGTSPAGELELHRQLAAVVSTAFVDDAELATPFGAVAPMPVAAASTGSADASADSDVPLSVDASPSLEAPRALLPEPAPDDAPVEGGISEEYLSSAEVAALRSEMSSRLADIHVLLREAEARVTDLSDGSHRVKRWLAVVVIVLFSVVAVGAWWVSTLQQQVDATRVRLATIEEASARTAALAAEQLTTMRRDADAAAAAARGATVRAEVMSAVLAAPDLARYGLAGVDGSPASAQLLWSRSRGFVLSAARLPSPPPASTYQVWLLTTGAPVSAGLLVPDAAGVASIIADAPPRITRRLQGVSITIEPAGGSAAPSERVVALNRVLPSTP